MNPDNLARFREWIARARRGYGPGGVYDTDLALFEAVAEEYAILQRRDDERADQ